jgi:peptide/nickel transport system permease protein
VKDEISQRAIDPQAPAAQSWTSPRQEMVRRFVRNTSGMVGLVLLVVLVVLHVGAPLFTSYDPKEMDVNVILKPPSSAHLFGTDAFGRDLYTRVLYGGRISLLVATVATALTTVFGLLVGAASGYYPRIDSVVMRAMDLVMAFPIMLLAITGVAVLGPNLLNVIVALTIPIIPRTARVVRSVVLSLKEQDFVLAARAIGAGDQRLILRHLIPNAMPTLIVRQTYVFGTAILIEGGLSFLGIGVEPEIPTLGMIVAEGRKYLREMPWICFSAGSFIGLLVLAVNLLGDGLRDVLDPRMKV